jgi:hypothetical protein
MHSSKKHKKTDIRSQICSLSYHVSKILNVLFVLIQMLLGCWWVLARPPREIIDQIHELILEDCQVSAKSIAEQLGISREWAGFIIHEDLDMPVASFLPGRAKDLSAPLY